MQQKHDEETPLLDEKRCHSNSNNNHRLSRRLSIAAIIISLISICFQGYLFYTRQRIVVSHETIHFDPPLVNEELVVAQQCGRPTIPWQSVYTLPYDMYSGLIIEQKTTRQLQIQEGHTKIRLNPDVADTTVYFDIKLVDKDDQQLITIQHDEPELGILRLILDTKKEDLLDTICITLDITIELPHLAAIDRLDLSVSNSDIEFLDNGVVLSEALALETANGNIAFKDLITTAMTLATSKGNIHAHLKHGMGDLSASTSVGDILLDATELDSPSRVDLAVSKGKAEAHLPDSFESAFTLSTVMGKAQVSSIDHPDRIHIERRGLTKLKGYYGTSRDSAAGSDVKLATVMGDAVVVYV